MNIVITLGVAAFALCLLWAVQSVMLVALGEPLAWPLRYTTPNRVMRWTGQMMIQVSWLIILLGTPLALGIPLFDALQQAFPLPPPWQRIAIVSAITFFGFCLLFALYFKAGWLQFHPRYDRATRRAKLVRRFLGPLPLAALEEAVFRGTLLEQLLRSLPQSLGYAAAAIVVSSLVFSLVHFIKPPRVIPVGQGIYGFFAAGCLFGLAYVVGGRNLWLPIAMHATAIFCVQMMRLYSFYKGPRYLAGFSEAPQSGLVGSLAMLGMAIALLALI